MNIIAWIFAGLAAGLLTSHLLHGRRAQGPAVTCVIGVAGALLGGLTATSLLPAQTLTGFVSLISWLAALTGAAILLSASHTLTGRFSQRGQPGEGMTAVSPARQTHASR